MDEDQLKDECLDIWNREEWGKDQKSAEIAKKIGVDVDVVKHDIDQWVFDQWRDWVSWSRGEYGYAFYFRGHFMKGYATGKIEGQTVRGNFVCPSEDGKWVNGEDREFITHAIGDYYAPLLNALSERLSVRNQNLKNTAGVPTREDRWGVEVKMLTPLDFPVCGPVAPDLLVEYIKRLPEGLRARYHQYSFSVEPGVSDWFAPFHEP